MFWKKCAAFLMAVMLGLCAQMPALAMMVVSTSYASSQEEEVQISSMAAFQDSLWVLQETGDLLRMDLATREQTLIGQCFYSGHYSDEKSLADIKADSERKSAPSVDQLFAWEDALYGLCLITGEWTRLLDATGAFAPEPMPVRLDTSAFHEKQDEYDSWYTPRGLFAQDGQLFYTVTTYGMNGQVSLAGQIDLKTGAMKAFQTKNLAEFTPWKEGKVLAKVFDEANAFDTTTGEVASAEYGWFDPKADAFEKLGELKAGGNIGGMGTSGLAANPAGNALFFSMGSRIMGLDVATGESRISAYTGEGMFGGINAGEQSVYVGGYYVRRGYSGLDLYKLDSEALQNGALRIFGEYGSEAHKSFTKAYPDIPVDVGEQYTNRLEDLTAAMVSGSDTYDVFVLDMAYMPVERLREKGYCQELSQYPAIMDVVSQMNPKFVEPLQKDGKLYAVPVEMNVNTMGVAIKTWTETLGLSKDELPKSYAELFEFLSNWEYDFADDHSDLRLMNGSPVKDMLFSIALGDYITYRQAKGEPMRFDTPEMRALLTNLESYDFSRLEQEENDREWKPALFETWYPVARFENQSYWSAEHQRERMPLSVEKGAEPVLGANLRVLVLNPKSARMDQAVLYAAHYLKNLNPTVEYITLFPDHNQPVESKGYPKEKEQVEKDLQEAKDRLAAAEESEKYSLQEEVSFMEERLADVEKSRYDVSAEAIADYRQNVEPLLHVNTMSAFLQGDNTELRTLLTQYMEGAIGQDAFIKGMDQRARMMELESQ